MILEHVSCRICGADDSKCLFETNDALTRSGTVFTIVQCNGCGMVYLNPRPKLEDISFYYPQEFNAYQFEIKSIDNTGVKARLLASIVRSSASDRVKAVKTLLKNPSASVLDIGCGKGSFLSVLKETTAMKGIGFDFDPASIEYGRTVLNLDVVDGSSEALEQWDEKFDLITMWHFLEHSYDPLTILRQCRRLLADEGVLVVEVPNADSLENRCFKSKSYLYDVPRHLLNFSPTTLCRLLEAAGFKVQQTKFQTFAGGWLGSVQQLLSGGRIYARMQEHVLALLVLSLLCYPIDRLAGAIGLGSIMRITARKA